MTAEHDELIEWDTVAIPFAAGVDLQTTERVVAAPNLLRLENGQFARNIGINKRRGHTESSVRTTEPLVATMLVSATPADTSRYTVDNVSKETSNVPPPNYLYGHGANPLSGKTTQSGQNESPYPYSTYLRGGTFRDTENLSWSGDRLYSQAPEQANGVSHSQRAPMPTADVYSVTGFTGDVDMADMAEGSAVTIYGWLSLGNAYVSLYDRTTGAVLHDKLKIADEVTDEPIAIRCIAVGDWLHAVIANETAAELNIYSYYKSADSLNTTTYLVAGTDITQFFDIRKVDERKWIVVWREGTTGDVLASYRKANGAQDGAISVTDLGIGTADTDNVAVAIHPVSKNVLVAHQDGTTVKATFYSPSLTSLYATATVATDPMDVYRLSCAFRYLKDETTGDDVGEVYWDNLAADEGDVPGLHVRRVVGATASEAITRGDLNYLRLGGHAHLVGNESFVIASYISDLQSTWFLLDSEMKPVGRFNYGQAGVDTISTNLPSVCYNVDDAALNPKDRYRWSCVLLRREQLDSVKRAKELASSGLYEERGITRIDLNYLPRLRSAEFGRSVYFTGAIASQYDGRTHQEVGWLLFPDAERIDYEEATTAGNRWDGSPYAMAIGNYTYRVYLCRRTETGEEVLSAAVTSANVEVTGINNSVELTIPVMTVSRLPDATNGQGYFKIFRREGETGGTPGTIWYLVSNPVLGGDGCPSNSVTGSTLTFIDGFSDEELLDKEEDPYNAGEAPELAPPGCTVIAVAKNRLWLAGGEVSRGCVLPSKQPRPNRAAAFFRGMEVTIGPVPTPVTAMSEVNSSCLIFRQHQIFALDGAGPSNTLDGDWEQPRQIVSPFGCVSPEGLALIPTGVLFHSPRGFMVMALNWLISDLGNEVQSETALDNTLFVGSVVSQGDNQLRLYRENGSALVYDWERRAWGTWTGLECTSAYMKNDLAVLTKSNGKLWVETDDVYTDAGRKYKLKLKTAFLSQSHLESFQRVRRVGWIGDANIADSYTLTFNIYMDDRRSVVHSWIWDPTVDLNSSTWGSGTWGSGYWGDALGERFRGDIPRGRKRLKRQKCSRVSVEIMVSDDGNAGFAPTAIILELGKRKGLARIGTAGTIAN